MARHRLIGVTGATGEVGGNVALRLGERGIPQRLIVRDPARAPKFERAEMVGASGYDDGDAMRRALRGIDTLFMVPAHETAHRADLHRSVVDAAASVNVKRIVYLSFLGARPDSVFTLARDHWHTEEHIRTLGLSFTFLRMNLYLDFLPKLISEDWVIRGPAGDGRVSAVARDDVAASVFSVLTEEGHEECTYNITGPEAFTLADAATVLSESTGRDVRFENETVDEAYASRAHFGAPGWEVEGWVSTYTAIASGELDAVSGDVQRLTGRPPKSLRDFAASLRQ